ncbi:MAG: GDYXXLXY domain-containing protein [Fimbriimonadales bacterium]
MFGKHKFFAFVIVICIQLAAALFMPVRAMVIRSNGTPVSLQLAPVDPYDMLTGYSLTLSYKASRLDSYPGLGLKPKRGQTVFVVLRKGAGPVWNPEAMLDKRPAKLRADQMVLKGTYDERDAGPGAYFGIETLYIPEASRERASQAISAFQTRSWQERSPGVVILPGDFARADIAIDRLGNASLLRLHIGDVVFE